MTIAPFTASEILTRSNGHKDFHTMTSSEVETLLSYADEHKYRKPKNANGSRARYFHAYLTRLSDKKFK